MMMLYGGLGLAVASPSYGEVRIIPALIMQACKR